MAITLIILLLAAVGFASGKIRADLVALCALLALLLSGILTPSEALAGFSSTVVIMMVGLFVVGSGIFHTGLAEQISNKMLSVAGQNPVRLHWIVLTVVACISGLISNTGTVALMIPIVASMAAKAGISPRRMFMPMAFASCIGGVMTLIGTPPNLVIQDVLVAHKLRPLGFFSFLPFGLVCTLAGILLMYPLAKWLLSPKRNTKRKKSGKSLHDLMEEYHLQQQMHRIDITNPNTPVIGKTLQELDIHSRYGITVTEIRRDGAKRSYATLWKGISQEAATPTSELQLNDSFYVLGTIEAVKQFTTELHLTLQEHSVTPEFYQMGIAEVMIPYKSIYVDETVVKMNLRKQFGLNVLAIQRNGKIIAEDSMTTKKAEEEVHSHVKALKDIAFKGGDIILVQGKWKNISTFTADTDNCIVLGKPLEEAAKVKLDYKAPVAALIMLAMIIVLAIPSLPIASVTAVMTAAVLMVVTKCLRNVDAAYKAINWETIVLIASMIPMSTALEKTGASTWFSSHLVSSFGAFGPWALLAGLYIASSLLTLFLNNTATAVLMAPIALSAATSMHVSPYSFLFAVAISTSMAFATPFATPPNALVMSPGGYSFMDYVKIGLPLQIIIGLIVVIMLPLFYPF